jgi:nicotinate-nucleotide--dimethylbenzimidazole phosphoribosyltransferase
MQPTIAGRLVAGHRSVEPGHAVVLDCLGLRPLLELDMRLGEGTGAAIAMQLVVAAAAMRDGMATFDEAAVSERR